MNKHGQSLVTFVLILPVIVLFLAFFIDSGISIMRKEKIDGIIKSNMESILQNDIRDINKIEKVLKNNDLNLNVNIKLENNELKINISSNDKSIFGNILKFEWYKMNFNYTLNYDNKEIKKIGCYNEEY